MIDLVQKTCPECGKRAIKIDRDKLGMRTCECGHTWYPVKKKLEDMKQ